MEIGHTPVASEEDAVDAGEGYPALPRHRVIRGIGEGAHGIVYLAETLDEPRIRCAVKVLRAGLSSPSAERRFDAERSALVRLDHPAIVAMHDAGRTTDDRPFFVMPVVAGEPVTSVAMQRALPVRARIEMFLEILGGVGHAHRHGSIHRDLKPSNILAERVDGCWRVRIIDWGLARALDSEGETPASLRTNGLGGTIGTPEFMSPEQASGGTLRGDASSDIWSLGALLYVLLTDRLPFPRESVRGISPSALAAYLRRTRPECPSKVAETAARSLELRGDLDAIVRKALDPDPARRYRHAEEFASDLRAHLEERPVSARRAREFMPAFEFVARHRRVMTWAAAGAIAVSAGALHTLYERASRRGAEMQAATAEASFAALLDDVVASCDHAEARTLVGEASKRLAVSPSARSGATLASSISVARALAVLGERRDAERMLREALGLAQTSDGAETQRTRGPFAPLAKGLDDADPTVRRALADLARLVASRQSPERFALATRILASATSFDANGVPNDLSSLSAMFAVLGDMAVETDAVGDLRAIRFSLTLEAMRGIPAERVVEHIERHAGSGSPLGLDARIVLLRKRIDLGDRERLLAALLSLHESIASDRRLSAQRGRIAVGVSLALAQLGRSAEVLQWIDAELPTLTERLGPIEPAILNLRFNRALLLATTDLDPSRTKQGMRDMLELAQLYARTQDPEAPMTRWVRRAILTQAAATLDVAVAEELRQGYLRSCEGLGASAVSVTELDAAIAEIRASVRQ
ncbi:MAG: protein kinase domain-containing protein [bacterium]